MPPIFCSFFFSSQVERLSMCQRTVPPLADNHGNVLCRAARTLFHFQREAGSVWSAESRCSFWWMIRELARSLKAIIKWSKTGWRAESVTHVLYSVWLKNKQMAKLGHQVLFLFFFSVHFRGPKGNRGRWNERNRREVVELCTHTSQ